MDSSIQNLFNDINNKDNIVLLDANESIVKSFVNDNSRFDGKLFYRVAKNCGGIIIDNWIRLYGCGDLNIITKNKYNKSFDLLIGEDICGGLFALKDDIVYYFALDTLAWESLDIYYSAFLNWLINEENKVSIFYETFRWNGWKDYCKNLKIDQGISFYPQLCFKGNIEDRSKKIVSMDEIINMNFDLVKKINSDNSIEEV